MNYNLIYNKIFMRTSLTVCAIALSFQLLCAEGVLGQSLKENDITYVVHQTSVNDAFEQLSKISGFNFFYDESVLKGLKSVSIQIREGTIDAILHELSRQTGLSFKKINNTISVSKGQAKRLFLAVEQNVKKVKGTIRDNHGDPIVGANVFVKGTTSGTVTDMDGNFSLEVPEQGTLVVSYIGYLTKEMPIGKGQQNVEIALIEDFQALDEVVVVGFAKQKKANLTGSVSSIKMDEVMGDRPVPTTGALLQGAVPGLQVTSGSGEPGGGLDFNIRGTTSINGGEPLILVDNVPFQGTLNLINPNDIESVTVLKDAASASIYGARSAFGVVLITTKGAQKEQKVQMTYSNNFSFSRPSNLPVKATPFQTVQAYSDMGYITYYSGQSVDTWLDLLHNYQANPSAYPEGYAEDGGMRYQLAQTDIMNDFLSETGFLQKHDFSINGGSERSSYRVSLGYTGSDGVMTTDMDSYKRYNAKGFISSKITNWLTGQLDISYYKSDKGLPSGANYSKAVWAPSYNPEGLINVNGEDLYSGTAGNLTRLGGQNTIGISDTRVFAKLIATPIKDMILNAEFTYDNLYNTETNYSKRIRFANADKFSEEYTSDYSTYNRQRAVKNYTALNIYGSYAKSLAKNNFTLLLGYNQESYHYDYLKAETSNMINDDMPSISQSTGVQKAYDGFSEYSVMGFFGRLNYDFDNRYLLGLNGRYDASSKFPPGSRWGFFPSLSVGWRVMEESFMEPLRDYIPEFKIRGSIGTVGNQNIDPYQFVPSMESAKSTWLDNNTQPITLKQPGLVSGNFTWETVRTLNLGFDLSALRNRLSANFDLFRRDTKDMLTSGSQLPATLGSSAPLQNVADLKSTGFELELTWRDQIGKVHYNIGFNLYDYKAYITKFKNNVAGVIRTSSNKTYVEGQRLGEIWGYVTDRLYTVDDFVEGSLDANLKNGTLKDGIPHVEGVKPNPGDMMFKDLDGNGIINSGNETIYDPGDRKIIGNNSLRFQYGINGGLSWNNFSFSFFLQGVGKCDKWLTNDLIFPYYYEFGTIYEHQLDYWTPEKTGAFFPRLYETGMRNTNYAANVRAQTKYLTNGAYLRVKNLTLGYTIPQSVISKIGINNLRVYVSTENPFTFDHMPKGLDPAVDSKASGLGYPFMSSYAFGFSVSL